MPVLVTDPSWRDQQDSQSCSIMYMIHVTRRDLMVTGGVMMTCARRSSFGSLFGPGIRLSLVGNSNVEIFHNMHVCIPLHA